MKGIHMNAEARRVARYGEAVFDAASAPEPFARPEDAGSGWSAGKGGRLAGVRMRLPGDGPSIEHRLNAQAAWITSRQYSGQAANDNADWPLAKLLKAESNARCLRLARLYREIHNAAHAVVDLVGRDASELPEARRLDIDEATGKLMDKGARQVGKTVRVVGLRTDATHPRPLSKPLPKAWAGDRPLLHRLDCQLALGAAQGALGPLRAPFEAAVVEGETLEAIGRRQGINSKNAANGAGRALVFLAFDELEKHWAEVGIAA